MKLNVGDYDTEVTGGDNWTPAMIAMWNAIKNTGGTFYFDEQLINLEGASPMVANPAHPVPLQWTGDGSSEISLEAGSSNIGFYLGNLTNIAVRDLVFSGKGADSVVDCAAVFYLGYVLRVLIDNCRFAGIRASSAVLYLGTGVSAHIKDCQISGGAGKQIHIDGAWSADIEHCEFLDYLQIGDTFHSKTPAGAGWIIAENPPASVGGNAASIRIHNCRLDEGSQYGIHIKDYPKVEISQVKINSFNSTTANSIRLENVKHAILKQNHYGYNAVDAPIVKLINCENVTIIGQGKDTTPYRIEKDSATNLKLLQSPGVVVQTV